MIRHLKMGNPSCLIMPLCSSFMLMFKALKGNTHNVPHYLQVAVVYQSPETLLELYFPLVVP